MISLIEKALSKPLSPSFRSEQPLNCLLNGGAEGAKSTTEARRYVKVEARDRESGGED